MWRHTLFSCYENCIIVIGYEYTMLFDFDHSNMYLILQAVTILLFQFAYSIAEYSVENSIIKPTYMLTYESATELLHLKLEEEAELRLLSESAALRLQWRRGQVSTVKAMHSLAFWH